jgi:hypothetical protein
VHEVLWKSCGWVLVCSEVLEDVRELLPVVQRFLNFGMLAKAFVTPWHIFCPHVGYFITGILSQIKLEIHEPEIPHGSEITACPQLPADSHIYASRIPASSSSAIVPQVC